MPVQFLSAQQRSAYGQYAGEPSALQLSRYFYLDDDERDLIRDKRGDPNRLGFALQLTTARFLGTFLEDPVRVPAAVMQTLVEQLELNDLDGLPDYSNATQRWEHTAEIKAKYGYSPQ